jgi:hypothetical protein
MRCVESDGASTRKQELRSQQAAILQNPQCQIHYIRSAVLELLYIERQTDRLGIFLEILVSNLQSGQFLWLVHVQREQDDTWLFGTKCDLLSDTQYTTTDHRAAWIKLTLHCMMWYDIWYRPIWYDMMTWYDVICDMTWYRPIYDTWYDFWYDMTCDDMIWANMIWHMIWYICDMWHDMI